MTKRYIFFFITILLLAGFGRMQSFGTIPTGFFCDEAAIGYNAYSLLHSGTDEYGIRLPVFFRSFGDFKNPVFIYSAVPFVALFGLTETAVRLLAWSYGILTIGAIYLLGVKVLGKKAGLIAALILSILPWHYHFSRIGFELISSVFWTTVAVLAAYNSLRRIHWYPIACAAFLASFLSYTATKIYIPLLFILFYFVNMRVVRTWVKDARFRVVSGFFLLLAVCLVAPSVQDGSFFSRWNQVKTENMQFKTMAQAYMNHFSPVFLFQKGDIDFPGQFVTRHSIRGIGELYWFQLPFILIALVSFFYSPRLKKALPILFLLLLYPLGSIFTGVPPQATRSVIGTIPLVLLTAIGITMAASWMKGKRWILLIASFMLTLIVAVSFGQFLKLYQAYPQYSSDYWGWQYGPEVIIPKLMADSSLYDELYLQPEFNGAEIFFKFYDPQKTCPHCRLGTPKEHLKPGVKQLFVVTPQYYQKSPVPLQILDIVSYPNGTPAFYFTRVKK